MVSVFSLIAMVMTLLVCTVAPILALIIYAVKNKGKGVWLAWFIGAAGFFVMQIVIRTPILSILSVSEGFVKFANDYYVVYILILAFTAALFEVVARFVGAIILKKKQCYEVAVGAGLGHGGIEAMFLIGMTYVNNLLYSVMINTGVFDAMIESTAQTGVDVTALWDMKKTLIETAPSMFLLAGYERILTMILHVAMTVLVFYFVDKKKSVIGVALCLLIHTVIDFVPGFVQGASIYGYLGGKFPIGVAYAIIYVFLTAMAVASIVIVISIRKKWKNQ